MDARVKPAHDRVALVARMSEAKCGAKAHQIPDVASLIRATRYSRSAAPRSPAV